MKVALVARSISRSVMERLRETFVARTLAVFGQVCDLVTFDGDVVAVVSAQVGDGPLNVVVAAAPGLGCGGMPGTVAFTGSSFDEWVEVGQPACLQGGVLHAGRLHVDLRSAVCWDPCPDWDLLRSRRESIAGRLPAALNAALRLTEDGSLLDLFSPSPARSRRGRPVRGDLGQDLLAAAHGAGSALRESWGRGGDLLRQGVVRLAGLGGGLTPAGDDFLCGAMLWVWLAHPKPQPCCQAILEVAAPRTTTLSAALLRAAGRGECGAAWHCLLDCLSAGTADELVPAVQGVLSHGATSGADALAGFLWLAIT